MPFKIIRNDITKVKADAIVNTANPHPVFAGGTDQAIYMAAGKAELLSQRQVIGDIKCGEVAVTDAFALDAKYIIHTVGPSWIDGKHGEFEDLRSCYEKSLQKAMELDCESIAFPLISTGVYGFPKDTALQIAVNAFSAFLLQHEMQIILVVFDKKSFQLSENIVGAIDSYIDANYVKKQRQAEYEINTCCEPTRIGLYSELEERTARRRTRKREKLSVQPPEKMEVELNEEIASECLQAPMTLEQELEQLGESFHEKLFELIAKAGIDNKDVWKRANLDRKHFSKIQCDSNYHPKKKTVMALCIALQLDLEESKDLLARADWAFSPSSKVDLIVQKAIIDKQYDIMQVNVTLFKYTNEILGV